MERTALLVGGPLDGQRKPRPVGKTPPGTRHSIAICLGDRKFAVYMYASDMRYHFEKVIEADQDSESFLEAMDREFPSTPSGN